MNTNIQPFSFISEVSINLKYIYPKTLSLKALWVAAL